MSEVSIASSQSQECDALPMAAGQSRSAFGSPKILQRHHERLAIVYVRQSDPQQVLQHRESKELQYNLVNRAVALGWSRGRVLVIDEDQGQSAQSAAGRHGFQHLLAEVALDHVGLVLGFQMSRLARSCKDWHQLLEVCARLTRGSSVTGSDRRERLTINLRNTTFGSSCAASEFAQAPLHSACRRFPSWPLRFLHQAGRWLPSLRFLSSTCSSFSTV